MPWSFGIPIGLLVALCGTILNYSSKKFKKLAMILIAGGLAFSALTLAGILLFLL
jgi:hypothetical protein